MFEYIFGVFASLLAVGGFFWFIHKLQNIDCSVHLDDDMKL